MYSLITVVKLIYRLCKRVVKATTSVSKWSVRIMVKIKYGGGVAQMSGSEAGRTYARNRGGAYIRNRTTPLNPSTPSQQSVRATLSQLSKDWSNLLTEEERDGWAAFAEVNPINDVFGESINLTGSQMYVRLNARLDEAGQTLLSVAPANQNVDALTSATLTFDIGTGNVELTFLPTPVPTDTCLIVKATPGLNPGINYVRNKLRTIGTFNAAEASPVDIEAEWVAKFGTLPIVGQRVVVQAHFLDHTTGAVSVAQRTDTFVIDTV